MASEHTGHSVAPNEWATLIDRRKVKAKTNYDFSIRGRLESSRKNVEWHATIPQPLEYLLYPSLNCLPVPAKTSSEGSPKMRRQGEVGDDCADLPAPESVNLRWSAQLHETAAGRAVSSIQGAVTLGTGAAKRILAPGTFEYDIEVRGEDRLRTTLRSAYETVIEKEKAAKFEALQRARKLKAMGLSPSDLGADDASSGGSSRLRKASSSRSRGSMIIKGLDLKQMEEVANKPEAIYVKMRKDSTKRLSLSSSVGVPVSLDQDPETEAYLRQKSLITQVLGPDDFTAEGLLYYRMNYDLEMQRQQELEDEEPTEMRDAPTLASLADESRSSSHPNTLRLARAHGRKGKAGIGVIDSDSSQVNLSGLQRALLSIKNEFLQADGMDLDFCTAVLEQPSVHTLPSASTFGPSQQSILQASSVVAPPGSPQRASAVSSSTRLAQDRLALAQLEAGKLPEHFIKRSNNLEFVEVDLTSFSIGDVHGTCLGKAIRGFHTLQTLNLNDNRLTGVSMVTIMKNASTVSLMRLCLSSNPLHGPGALAVAAFLSTQNVLQDLAMSNCKLNCEDMAQICRAISKDTSLALTGLDFSSNHVSLEGVTALSAILNKTKTRLANINLAWNDIGTPGVIGLAGALAKNTSVTHINLSGNSISDPGGQRIAEALLTNTAVVDMNLSQNLIGGCSCFVFSKAVMRHPTIMKLDLSRNPVGEAGARSLYRTILRGLRCFVVMRSCSYFQDDNIFNYSTPSAHSPYDLDLAEPYKMAVLLELVTMAVEDPVSCRFGPTVWHEGKAGGREEQLQLAAKDGALYNKATGKKWNVPQQGRMVVNFYSSVAIPTLERAATSNTVNIIQAIVIGAREEDRVDYLRLFCTDVYCTTAQAQGMINKFIERRILGSGGLRKMDVVSCIWSRLIDTKNMYDFLCNNVPPHERRDLINTLTIEEFRFNWSNPSGHWRLNLENRTQRMVMNKIIALNASEALFSRRKSRRGDTSQEGNWFNFRNGKYSSSSKSTKDVLIDQAFVDNLPQSGTLEFDYVSTTRPGHGFEIVPIEEKGEGENGEAGAEGEREGEAEGEVEGEAEAEAEGDEEEYGGVGGEVTSEAVETSAMSQTASLTKGSSELHDDEERGDTISRDEFVDLLVKLRLSSRNKISRDNVLFPLMELQLAVTKYFFTVANGISILECFAPDPISLAKVVVALFNRIRDLYNMDVLLRTLAPAAQREVLSRLGCLNVLNPLKLSMDYFISMKHLDERVLLQLLLEISPHEGTDQIIESPKTDVSVITFYGALHRITSSVRDDRLIFYYCEVGEKTTIVAWGMRREGLRKFLIGTKPYEKGLFRCIKMWNEMNQHGTFTRGPIELQYTSHLKAMATIRRQGASRKSSAATVQQLQQGSRLTTGTTTLPTIES